MNNEQKTKYTLLYAEDDPLTAEINIAFFEKVGYEVIYAEDGNVALAKYKEKHPDIILLDIMMPPGLTAGYDVAREIRRMDESVPILFLTCLREPECAVKGLSLGADDFIRKETAPAELVARMASKLRNYHPKQETAIEVTPYTTLNTVDRCIVIHGKSYHLTLKEYELMLFFSRHINIINERRVLEEYLWGDNSNGDNYLNKCISSVRAIIRDDDTIEIVSFNRIGVMLRKKE